MAEKKKELYSLTEEHRKQLKPWADKWIANALDCKPLDKADKAACIKAINGLYEAAKLDKPLHIVFVPSPLVAAIAGAVSAGVWNIYENNAGVEAQVEEAVELAVKKAVTVIQDETARKNVYHESMKAIKAVCVGASEQLSKGAKKDASKAKAAPATKGTAADSIDNAKSEGNVNDASNGISKALANVANNSQHDKNELVKFLLGCLKHYYNMWNGGNQWSAWVSYLSFFKNVVKLDLPQYDAFEHYEKAAIHGGPRMMHPKFCIVSDRPLQVLLDAQNRPHADGQPYCKWSDGSALYYLHGVMMDPKHVMTPAEKINLEEVLKVANAEQRRELFRKFIAGGKRVTDYPGTKVLDKDGNYELLEISPTGLPTSRWLKMLNPSVGTWHIEGIANTMPRESSVGADQPITTVAMALHFRKPAALRNLPVDDVHGADWVQQGDVCVWPKDAKVVKARPSVLT